MYSASLLARKTAMPDKVLRRAHAAIGHRLADQFLLLALRPVFIFGEQRIDVIPVLAVDDARGNRVDVDAVLDQVEPRRLGQRDDGGLGGAIDADQCFAAPSGLACHVDDPAALASARSSSGRPPAA
jgi:hypothetical protein